MDIVWIDNGTYWTVIWMNKSGTESGLLYEVAKHHTAGVSR
jgi:hypothetical protein